jgi:predicted Zn-dependent protease
VAKTFFEAIGYRLGQKAAQAKSVFDLLGGTEEESLRAEIRLGRDLEAALLERTPLIAENETTRFVAQIARWLAANVKEKKLPFSVRVTAEREPNAFALPGGPVFVSWPLLEMCQGCSLNSVLEDHRVWFILWNAHCGRYQRSRHGPEAQVGDHP